jgi:4-diphosphocytidyl-2-C-methyl-D-erythritol kinase
LPPLPRVPIVLVNPGVSVSTADVFRALATKNNPPASMPTQFTSMDRLVDYLHTTRNDLEAPARHVAPVIGDALSALAREGASFVRMSGSGATCFGLFASASDAGRAADAIAHANPGWWIKMGVLTNGGGSKAGK